METKMDSHILVVEDDRFFAELLQKRIVEELGYGVILAGSLAETSELLNDLGHKEIIAAILDYHIPDAPNGEIIKAVIDHNIPVIAYTGLVDSQVRDNIWSNYVADYAIKGDPNSIDYVISVIKRIAHNNERQVLVVDDSILFQRVLTKWLQIQRYQVLTSTSGKGALELLRRYPGIKLAIIDYFMPEMDGIELIHTIRESHKKEQLAIIGISGQGNSEMSVNFLKSGANDFLVKEHIIPEEFYCRVNQCLENNENIQAIREAAIKDFLTGLYNRRYFFEVGRKFLAAAQRQGTTIACAMVDIDFFKKVNDEYGHEAGDLALQQVASILGEMSRTADLVARLGGEEFCILAMDIKGDSVATFFDLIRQRVEETTINITSDRKLSVTISIGVCSSAQNSLEEMLASADTKLYEAKESGRNRVIIG